MKLKLKIARKMKAPGMIDCHDHFRNLTPGLPVGEGLRLDELLRVLWSLLGQQGTAEYHLGALQIAPISRQRVRRRTSLGGEHFEESVDRARDQPRVTASAAIIRASGSSPTRRSAETMW